MVVPPGATIRGANCNLPHGPAGVERGLRVDQLHADVRPRAVGGGEAERKIGRDRKKGRGTVTRRDVLAERRTERDRPRH